MRRCYLVNNLYLFKYNGKKFYAAAPNWNQARNIVLRSHNELKSIALPNLVGKVISKKCTEKEGVISISVICKEMAWWECSCGCKIFTALDAGDICRCDYCQKELRTEL